MAGSPIALLLSIGVLATPSAAAADENTPCTSSRAKPQISLVDRGAGSAVYATQELGVKLTQAGEEGVAARSIAAPGARVDTEGAGGGLAALLWIDRPGPLTVTVRAADRDPALDPASTGADNECTHTVSQTFSISAATVTKAGKLKRPFLVDRRRRLWYRRVYYSFSVRPEGAAADRSPLTVRVRTIRRARYPSARTRAVSQAYGLRSFDVEEPPFKRGCQSLVCPPKARNGSAKALEVRVDDVRGGLKISVVVPTAYPGKSGRRLIPTPWGVDVEVFQSGRRVARLRAAGRCTEGGQAARCTFKRVSAKP